MNARTGLVYADAYLRHDTGAHPENADRLRRTLQLLTSDPIWNELEHIQPQRATVEQIGYVHEPDYVRMIEEACRTGRRFLDADTAVCPSSYEVALLATGGVLAAIDAIFEGRVGNVFCLVRPPGHHAEPNRAMGFCLFNNVAIGVRYVQREYGLDRIAIIDWDLHHGNGTQRIFYDDPSVFYVSLHQYPHYPGTGWRDEIGAGRGEGYTLNFPMSVSDGNEEYLGALEGEVLPELRRYDPELVLISAGFDAHRDDPLGGISLSNEGFFKLTEMAVKLAGECCKGRILSSLEGGYNLDVLPHSILAHLRALSET